MRIPGHGQVVMALEEGIRQRNPRRAGGKTQSVNDVIKYVEINKVICEPQAISGQYRLQAAGTAPFLFGGVVAGTQSRCHRAGSGHRSATTRETFWKRLIAGECGIDRITAFDPPTTMQVAGQVTNLDVAAAFPNPKEVRRTDRFSQFGVHAGWRALKDSGDLSKLNCGRNRRHPRLGIGGLETTQAQVKVLLERGPSRLSPFMIPMLISNMASGLFSDATICVALNCRLPACATANHAIGEAWRTSRCGRFSDVCGR